MKLKPFKRIHVLIPFGVIALVCLIRLLQIDFFERLEWITYDMRVRQAAKLTPPVTTNFGFVCVSEDSLKAVLNNTPELGLGNSFGLYWPRQIYGRVVNELTAQGAKTIAFDIMFGGLRVDHMPVNMTDGKQIPSDDYFAREIREAGNVLLAITEDVIPPKLFTTNALGVGHISTDKDSDGVLRRARPFRVYTNWHPAFLQAQADPELGIDLTKAKIEKDKIILQRDKSKGLEDIPVPLDADGNFDLAGFGANLPPGASQKAKPFATERVWHMGLLVAAQQLNLDLSKTEMDIPHRTLVLHGPDNLERIIPLATDGTFYIDWCLTPDDPRIFKQPIEDLLKENYLRIQDETNTLRNHWTGKLAIIGSSAVGNELSDRGATPLRPDTLLVSKHWNVANSIITGRFIRRTTRQTDLLLIVGMGVLAALLSLQARPMLAFLLVMLSVTLYSVVGTYLYAGFRWWIPLVPVVIVGMMTNLCLVTWRVVFEQSEKRRVKSIFSKIVSPNIVNELLQSEKLALGGTRREITVFFADVRGFTEFTDTSQEEAADYVRQHKLSGAAEEVFYDERAREMLSTVNTYLAIVADMVKKHDGTLDKYIGDCVMAFWGAPTPDPKHALACVLTAIDAQRAVYDLNFQRIAENENRKTENEARIALCEIPKPMLPILLLGSGINTGMATVGLMGSEAHLSNYTVFGREVNLASRLEGLSGRGRILISEKTYEHLQRDDPTLAATCVTLPPAQVKGFRTAIKVYEVPWRQGESLPTVSAELPTGFFTKESR